MIKNLINFINEKFCYFKSENRLSDNQDFGSKGNSRYGMGCKFQQSEGCKGANININNYTWDIYCFSSIFLIRSFE